MKPNAKQLKICILSGDTSIYKKKLETPFKETLSGIARQVESVQVFAPFQTRYNYTTKNITVRGFGKQWLGFLKLSVWDIPQYLSTQKPSLLVAHAYGFFHLAYIARFWSIVFGIPLLVDLFHIDGYPTITQKREKITNVFAWIFIKVYGKKTQYRVMHRVQIPNLLAAMGVARENIHYLSAIHLNKPDYQIAPPPQKIYDISFVARLESNKGLDIFLDALTKLKKENRTVLIVGTGSLENELTDFIADHPEVTITHIERIDSKKELLREISKAKAFVCSSLVEGGPRTVIEAMALGIPVISSRVGIVEEVIIDRETGILFDGTAKDLTNAIQEALENTKFAQKIGKGGKKRVEEFFDPEHYKKYVDLYQEIAFSNFSTATSNE